MFLMCVYQVKLSQIEPWLVIGTCNQDCAESHTVNLLFNSLLSLLLLLVSSHVSFPSCFYWPLKSSGLSSPLPVLSHFLGVLRSLGSSLCSVWAVAHGNTALQSFTDTHNPRFNRALYFPFPSCSQHDLTTLLPPPKTYYSISWSRGASVNSFPVS